MSEHPLTKKSLIMLGLLMVGATATNNLRYTGIGGNNSHKNGGVVGVNNGGKNCDNNGNVGTDNGNDCNNNDGNVGDNNVALPICEEEPVVSSNDNSGRVDANTGSQVRIIV